MFASALPFGLSAKLKIWLFEIEDKWSNFKFGYLRAENFCTFKTLLGLASRYGLFRKDFSLKPARSIGTFRSRSGDFEEQLDFESVEHTETAELFMNGLKKMEK